MGKTSKAHRVSAAESTKPSVSQSLNHIIKTEEHINAEIEQARLEARAILGHAQESIPGIIESIEHDARMKAEDEERRIAQESAMKIASIQEEGLREANALRDRLNRNFETAVEFVVKQVTRKE